MSEAKQTPQSWLRQSGFPAGEPKAGERSSPINCKVEASDLTNFCNQTFNSRAAVFDDQRRRARERLAKQDARARTRSSSGAFACECAEQPIESRELGTTARRCRGAQGDSPCFAFLLQAFSFSNKKKMPKRGEYISFDYSGTRRQSANPASSYRAAAAVAVRRVAASCKFCVNNFVQTLRADDIRPYLL